MITKSQTTIELVNILAGTIAVRKEAEKREKELKEQVRAIMGEDLILDAGGNCVIISTRSRTDLDKEAIMHDLGKSFFDQYSKRSSYDIMEVKPKSKEVSNVG